MQPGILYLKYAQDVLLRQLCVVVYALQQQTVGYHIFNLRYYLLVYTLLELSAVTHRLCEQVLFAHSILLTHSVLPSGQIS